MPRSRTLVIHPQFRRERAPARSVEGKLAEACGLAEAINLEVVLHRALTVVRPRPATLFGKGQTEEIAELVGAHDVALAVVNGALSPVQQRNLEKAWNCKVIDRTALILEIFGARARTREGRLQVELAALEYQKSRLVRSWTHLERQRGGFGFLGGPGESQIELDRRMLRDRIARLKHDLETVTRTRALHRRKRRSVPYPVIALVGYTNAGKSTLFNRMTGADAVAADRLFATLDPAMRALRLPAGVTAILSDTVGFVSNLPTELIAAFRATLEEVLEADLLLHVRDVAHPESAAQKEDVQAVLKALFSREDLPTEIIEVMNKVDQLPPDSLPPAAIGVSALTGAGMERLLAVLDAHVREHFRTSVDFVLPAAAAGEMVAWLHRNGQVVKKASEMEMLHVSALLAPQDIARFEKRFNVRALT